MPCLNQSIQGNFDLLWLKLSIWEYQNYIHKQCHDVSIMVSVSVCLWPLRDSWKSQMLILLTNPRSTKLNIIADISHHHHHRQWSTFFEPMSILAFSHFWLFCHKFRHLLVPLLQREAPFWNVLVLNGHYPNNFGSPPLSNRQTWKKVPQTILTSPYNPRQMWEKVPQAFKSPPWRATHFIKGLPLPKAGDCGQNCPNLFFVPINY